MLIYCVKSDHVLYSINYGIPSTRHPFDSQSWVQVMAVDWSSGSTPTNYTAHEEDGKISLNVIICWSHQLWGCVGGGELRHYEVTWHIQHRPRPLPLSLSLSLSSFGGSGGDLFDLSGVGVSDGDLPPAAPVLLWNQPHSERVPATLWEEETIEPREFPSSWRIIQ